MDSIRVGRRLKQARINKQMTQAVAAEILGMETSSLSNIERGARVPGVETFLSMANLYELSLDELFLEEVPHGRALLCSQLSDMIAGLDRIRSKMVLDIIQTMLKGFQDIEREERERYL